ncbi:unnamed protein product [Cuscuta epithymum]|uniref:Uncharacterized protein n=1 Tax=Cuscuta epithymum TaxID=186058 RepID=A0AAV0DVV7_9ASTE|nr:unnamed protein product [Cuscuta epithymum]
MASATATTAEKANQSSFSREKSVTLTLLVSISLVSVVWSFTDHSLRSKLTEHIYSIDRSAVDRSSDPPEKTFYDDPELNYTINRHRPIVDWDGKRSEWLKLHPSFAAGVENRVLLLTGSKPGPCKNPAGDHLLLRCFKNKVDYCRIHGHDIFYNNAFFHPEMRFYWAKIPLVRAAMLAHPETEWVLWMDSDAIFTDMDFKIPLERYRNHNFVVHGWPAAVVRKSWVAVNAGIFLIRNCQWSMGFLDEWAKMGPQSPDYEKWGEIQRSTLKDKMFPESDDQSGLVYLLLKGGKKWTDKIYVENEYSLHGYWVEIVGRLDNITARYAEIERGEPSLRRRHAEAVSESYAAAWEPHVAEGGERKGRWRRPFITHFTGCQPCSGNHNLEYGGDSCWEGMERALNFGDNQVLRNFGFMHSDLKTLSPLMPEPYDHPS